MFPHVDAQYRTTYCDNSIWNIEGEMRMKGNRTPGPAIQKVSSGTLGLGQIFMRKYGMHISYKKDGTAVYMINQGVDLSPQWIVILIWSFILGVLALGVVLLARKKY